MDVTQIGAAAVALSGAFIMGSVYVDDWTDKEPRLALFVGGAVLLVVGLLFIFGVLNTVEFETP